MPRLALPRFHHLLLGSLLALMAAPTMAASPECPIRATLARTIESHGMSPATYGLDASATDCTIRANQLVQALHDIRVGLGDDRRIDAKERGQLQLVSHLLWAYSALSPKDAERHLGGLIDRLAPQHPVYTKMRRIYGDYLELAAKGGLPRIPDGKALKPGQSDPRVDRLRRYLILTGDYAVKDWSNVPSSSAFDKELQAALKQFQQRHGLNMDGALGKETLEALNTPLSDRLTKLALTMERLRHIAPPNAQDYIHVNLPSFRLTAYEKGKASLQMRVIVGERRNPTPEFSNQITQMVLNPTWTPTPKILKNEMLPKARNNPASLNGYHVTSRHTGERLDPMTVDWSNVGLSDVHIVQPSGSGNALGKVKFLMPKSDSIYLHDTARPQLFSQSFRALSHGCIRLEKPRDLAKFVLQLGRPQDAPKLDAAYDSSTPRTYAIERPLPVVSTYFTAWVNENGQPEFYPDIYGRDARLQAKLKLTTRDENQLALR